MSSSSRRLVFLVLLPMLPAASAAIAQDIPCRPALSLLIQEHGQFLNTFTDVHMQSYAWANDADPQVSGWRFSGVPPQCTGGMAGKVVASL